MKEKIFIVTHGRARAPLTIRGKTLELALKKDGLNPAIWKLLGEQPVTEEEESGDNQGDAGPQDY